MKRKTVKKNRMFTANLVAKTYLAITMSMIACGLYTKTLPPKTVVHAQTVGTHHLTHSHGVGVSTPVPTVTSTPTPTPYPNDFYKSYIYFHESGNNPQAINDESGACGLGQALPCSKLPCSLTDYACQDQWFTDYAINRYGSWENAYYFWINNNWW